MITVPEQSEININGNVIATDVTFEEYMERYAAHFCEWIEGVVIQMSPVHEKHDGLTFYLRQLVETYFELRPIGQVRSAPFVLKLLPEVRFGREPDLMIILHTNPHQLTATAMNGPADICIEVISEESIARDHGDKFMEYEKGGVGEYWIIDPIHKDTRFYLLNEAGVYVPQPVDADGYYHSPTLPGLRLHIPTLWQEQLPGPGATVKAVAAMLNESA